MKVIKELRKKLALLTDNLSIAESSWSRKYDFYLIFGQTDLSKSPWIKNNWKSDFEPFFELLIQQSKNFKETGIRVVKYKPEKRVAKRDNNEFIYHNHIKLGRLKWDEKSHEKWTIL